MSKMGDSWRRTLAWCALHQYPTRAVLENSEIGEALTGHDLDELTNREAWDKFVASVRREVAADDYRESADGSRLIDAQAELQSALGFYRLDHELGDPIEQGLRAGMDLIHDVLKDHGIVMGRHLSAALREMGIREQGGPGAEDGERPASMPSMIDEGAH